MVSDIQLELLCRKNRQTHAHKCILCKLALSIYYSAEQLHTSHILTNSSSVVISFLSVTFTISPSCLALGILTLMTLTRENGHSGKTSAALSSVSSPVLSCNGSRECLYSRNYGQFTIWALYFIACQGLFDLYGSQSNSHPGHYAMVWVTSKNYHVILERWALRCLQLWK